MRVFKYPLAVEFGDQHIEVPRGALPLSVHLQDGEPMLWALVDDEGELRDTLCVTIIGTGHYLDRDDFDTAGGGGLRFLGTVLMDRGARALHVFVATPGPLAVSDDGFVIDADGRVVADPRTLDPELPGNQGQMDANAHLFAAAPLLADALEAEDALIVQAQELCERTLLPASDPKALGLDRFQRFMVALLDGPLQREAQDKARAALAAATPDGQERSS